MSPDSSRARISGATWPLARNSSITSGVIISGVSAGGASPGCGASISWLKVQKGRLVVSGAGATAPVEVGEGQVLVRRNEPRPEEKHPLLRFYESARIR